jgi:hypothetical protein
VERADGDGCPHNPGENCRPAIGSLDHSASFGRGGWAARHADIRIAEKFATLAAGAQRLDDVPINLQKALNCLEGPQGPEYRRSAGEPCSGSGAVNEFADGSI